MKRFIVVIIVLLLFFSYEYFKEVRLIFTTSNVERIFIKLPNKYHVYNESFYGGNFKLIKEELKQLDIGDIKKCISLCKIEIMKDNHSYWELYKKYGRQLIIEDFNDYFNYKTVKAKAIIRNEFFRYSDLIIEEYKKTDNLIYKENIIDCIDEIFRENDFEYFNNNKKNLQIISNFIEYVLKDRHKELGRKMFNIARYNIGYADEYKNYFGDDEYIDLWMEKFRKLTFERYIGKSINKSNERKVKTEGLELKLNKMKENLETM